MKRYFLLKYGFVICVVCLLLGCQVRNQNFDIKEKCSLTIVCDSSFNKNLMHELYLITSNDTIEISNIKYDSLTNSTTIKWDSLRKEEYHFEVLSVFRQKSETSFYLNNDTTIKLVNKYRPELKDAIDKETLLKSDTVVFAFQTTGCSYNIGIYTLTKNNGKYMLEGSKRRGLNPIRKVVSSDIINDLYQTQIYCRNHNFQGCISTRAYQFMILADNKVFYFDDKFSGGVEAFSQFERKYIYEKQEAIH